MRLLEYSGASTPCAEAFSSLAGTTRAPVSAFPLRRGCAHPIRSHPLPMQVMILKAVTESTGGDFETFDVLSDQDVSLSRARAAAAPALPRCCRAHAAAARRTALSRRLGPPHRSQVREGIKQYSNWPTIPQCYIDGEFIGGCDLLIEMYQNGELSEMVEKSMAS